MSEAGCYSNDTRDLYPPWPWDYLTHREAIAKRDELNIRNNKMPGDHGGFEIIRASIFYRVTHGPVPDYMRVPDSPAQQN